MKIEEAGEIERGGKKEEEGRGRDVAVGSDGNSRCRDRYRMVDKKSNMELEKQVEKRGCVRRGPSICCRGSRPGPSP